MAARCACRAPEKTRAQPLVVDFPLSLDRDGLVPAPAATVLSVWARQIEEGGGRLWLRGVKVVFVDDDSDSRELVKRVLSEHGADVWTAGSSDEGRSVFSEVRPDVLVSDIGMPREDGYELIRAIRALPDRSRRRRQRRQP